MIQLHPPLSGAPLAGLLLLIVVELGVLARRTRGAAKGCRALVVCATISAVLCSFISGYQASGALGVLSPEIEQMVAKHHSVGRFLLINVLLLGTFFFLSRVAIHGRRLLTSLYYVTVVAQILLTVWAGRIGGSLVFDHGVGVAPVAVQRQ